MAPDRKRLNISVESEHMRQLRTLAASHETSPGVVARALITHGLEVLDEEVAQAAIEHEVAQESARRAEVGRAAMAARWAKEES